MDSHVASPRSAARARELLVVASIIACVLWGLTGFDLSSGTLRGRLSGLPIGTDFVNFYAMAHVGRSGRYEVLASFESFRAEQQRLIPSAADSPYPPVYPPQVALVMSPLASLTYLQAYLVWAGITLLLYAGAVWMMFRASASLRAWPRHVAVVALASPSLWLVVMHGQVSIVPLLALVGMWLGLRARQPWVAGIALGLMAFKPSLFLPAVALCLICGEWRMTVGATVVAFLQYALVIPWAGIDALLHYAATTRALLLTPDLVASNAPLMHSLRTFWTGLLPAPWATLAYAVSAAAVMLHSAMAWRRVPDALGRAAIMGAAVVLASPHVFAYDLLILTPLLLASAERLLRAPGRSALRSLTYAGFFAPVWGIPVAALGFQASTLAISSWLMAFISVTRRHSTTSTTLDRLRPVSLEAPFADAD